MEEETVRKSEEISNRNTHLKIALAFNWSILKPIYNMNSLKPQRLPSANATLAKQVKSGKLEEKSRILLTYPAGKTG